MSERQIGAIVAIGIGLLLLVGPTIVLIWAHVVYTTGISFSGLLRLVALAAVGGGLISLGCRIMRARREAA